MKNSVVTMLIFLVALLMVPRISSAQVDSFETVFNLQYEKNIKKERLNGVYIPRDMEDAFIELERLSDPAGIQKFRSAPEEVIERKLHFGLGKWMIVNWNLYDGSRFSHYLKEMGVSHPDDMAQFTIVSWHRHLNGKELELAERAKHYEELRKSLLENKTDIQRDSVKVQSRDSIK